jgi:hypothetical protein
MLPISSWTSFKDYGTLAVPSHLQKMPRALQKELSALYNVKKFLDFFLLRAISTFLDPDPGS